VLGAGIGFADSRSPANFLTSPAWMESVIETLGDCGDACHGDIRGQDKPNLFIGLP